MCHSHRNDKDVYISLVPQRAVFLSGRGQPAPYSGQLEYNCLQDLSRRASKTPFSSSENMADHAATDNDSNSLLNNNKAEEEINNLENDELEGAVPMNVLKNASALVNGGSTIKRNSAFRPSVIAKSVDSPTSERPNSASHRPRFRDQISVIYENPRKNSTRTVSESSQQSTAEVSIPLNQMQHQTNSSNSSKNENGKDQEQDNTNLLLPEEKQPVSLNEVWSFFTTKMRTKKKEIRLNCFLFFLLGLIITSIFIFMAINPEHPPDYTFSITDYAVLMPLAKRLELRHPHRTDIRALEISWGFHQPASSIRLPSYCMNTNNDCTHQGKCCLRYTSHSHLDITTYELGNGTVGCVRYNWTRDTPQDDEVKMIPELSLSDCVFVGQERMWYGGLLQSNSSWTKSFRTQPFTLALTGDPANNPSDSGAIGVLEPFWISSDGYAFWVESSAPLYVNSTAEYFCIRSVNTLAYSVCQGRDLRQLYHAASHTPRDSVNLEDIITEEAELAKPIGKILLAINSTKLIDLDYRKTLLNTLKRYWTDQSITASSKKELVMSLQNSGIFAYDEHENATLEFIDMVKSMKESADLARVQFIVQVSNYLSAEKIKETNYFWDKLIWQTQDATNLRSTGLVLWEDSLCEVLDITNENVFDWLLEQISDWPLYQKADYLSLQGGAATVLPASATLNVSDGNSNFYSQRYVELAESLDKTLTVAVGFRTQASAPYVLFGVTPEGLESVIPLALSLGLHGYSRFGLDLNALNLPAAFNRDAESVLLRSLDELTVTYNSRHLLELSMFFPIVRLPLDFALPLNGNASVPVGGFVDTLRKFAALRQSTVLPHYSRALARHAAGASGPVVRPMWWNDEGASVDSHIRHLSLNISNQFMVGNDLIVVSYIGQGQQRNNVVYFPKGVWKDPMWGQGLVRVPKGQFLIYFSHSSVTCFERVKEEEDSSS